MPREQGLHLLCFQGTPGETGMAGLLFPLASLNFTLGWLQAKITPALCKTTLRVVLSVFLYRAYLRTYCLRSLVALPFPKCAHPLSSPAWAPGHPTAGRRFVQEFQCCFHLDGIPLFFCLLNACLPFFL